MAPVGMVLSVIVSRVGRWERVALEQATRRPVRDVGINRTHRL